MKNKFWLAFICFVASYIIYIFSQQVLQLIFDIYFSIIISQLFFFLLPILFVSYSLSFNFRSIFRINRLFNFSLYIYTFILFCSLFLFIHSLIFIQLTFLPESFKILVQEHSKNTEYILRDLAKDSLPWALLSLAVVPAIVEELIFRGFLQKIFEHRYGAHLGIIYTSLIFALLHFNLLNLIPLFLLSFVIGKIALYTNSIFPGIIIHFLVNTTTIISKSFYSGFLDAEQDYQFSLEILLLFIFSLFVTMIIVHTFKRNYNYKVNY